MTARRRLAALVVLAAFPVPLALAGHWFHRERGTPPPGRPRSIEHSDARAGEPRTLRCCTEPTNGAAYAGYYVGGGAGCCGEPRRIDEGTFGWDYRGSLFPRRVGLSWSHGRLGQGGEGSYRTDGCRLRATP